MPNCDSHLPPKYAAIRPALSRRLTLALSGTTRQRVRKPCLGGPRVADMRDFYAALEYVLVDAALLEKHNTCRAEMLARVSVAMLHTRNVNAVVDAVLSAIDECFD